MALLTRDAILAASDLKREEVQVPEWGGSVFVRELTADERDELELSCYKERKKTGRPVCNHYRATVVSLSVVDDQGNRIFAPADVPALAKKSASVIDRLVTAAGKLSAITKEDVEELQGN